ncbi:hypothetical protein BKA64DRAFT_699302 [Cadophora sp. MPI-SDFR-AT-0126]|nr:hypothetical protein BKA64DRAFT_699302 [Leotiomycetes sp. MPI-SDFR-AT-0126]
MKLPTIPLILAAASLPLTIHACMEFNGTLPFSHTAPFEASITDNGVVTCWISTTLAEHNSMQDELYSHQHSHNWKARSKLKKRSVGRKISLTELPAYDPSSSSQSKSNSQSQYKSLPGPSSSLQDSQHVDLTHPPPPHNGELPKTQKMEELEWDDIPVWQPWNFECISGHKAKANVGMRGFTYVAHGQDFHFVPKMREDVWGERWIYSLRLWCGEKDKQGKVVERPKPKGKGNVQGQKKQEVKGQAAPVAAAGSPGKKEGQGRKSGTSGGSVAKSGLKE